MKTKKELIKIILDNGKVEAQAIIEDSEKLAQLLSVLRRANKIGKMLLDRLEWIKNQQKLLGVEDIEDKD